MYLHYSGFRKIENLEAYTGLKALWLDSNGISSIEGISHLADLRCLYLQSNLIERIDGLRGLDQLQTLNLANNRIFEIANLDFLPRLQTLNLSKNAISDVSTLVHLQGCCALTNLDLSDNALAGDASAGLAQVLAGVPKLVTLYLKGNPCVRETRHYRKVVVAAMPSLRYLDDRPVFEAERLATDAWAAGGQEAELKARRDYEDRERDKSRANMERFKDWQEEVRARRAKELDDFNTARRAAGELEVTELPRRSYVSYSRVTTKYQTETARLARLAERAESLAKAGGYNETAMMDLGRQWWQEEGILDPEGHLVRRHEDDADGNEAAATMTEQDEEEEQRHVTEDILRQEREERARQRGEKPVDQASEYTDPDGVEISVAAGDDSAPRVPTAPAVAEAANSLPEDPQARETRMRIERSLQIYKERYGEAARPHAADGETGVESSSSLSPPRRGLMERVAAARQEAASDAERALAREPAPGDTGLPFSAWWPALEAALVKFVPQAEFDFDKVAKALKSAVLRGKLALPDGAGAQEVAAFLDGPACRVRYAQLTSPAAESASAPASSSSSGAPEASSGRPLPLSPSAPAQYAVRPGSGVGSRAPHVMALKEGDAGAAHRAVAGTRPSADGPLRAANLLPVPAMFAVEGQENSAGMAHVKPVSELVRGDFALERFRDYVRAPDLPSMRMRAVASGAHGPRGGDSEMGHESSSASEPRAGRDEPEEGGSEGRYEEAGEDDDDDDDEEMPVTREQILAGLRSGGTALVGRSRAQPVVGTSSAHTDVDGLD